MVKRRRNKSISSRALLVKQIIKTQIGQNKLSYYARSKRWTSMQANAVLKALEEPAPRTYLCLPSTIHQSFTQTIRSRWSFGSGPTRLLMTLNSGCLSFQITQGWSSLFWVNIQPFRLISIQQTKVRLNYTLACLSSWIQCCKVRRQLVCKFKRLDSNNIGDLLQRLAAICIQCICHSTGGSLGWWLTFDLFDLITRLSINRSCCVIQALQKLEIQILKKQT